MATKVTLNELKRLVKRIIRETEEQWYDDGSDYGFDNISRAKYSAYDKTDFLKDAIEYVGGITKWNKLTKDEQADVIDDLKTSWKRSHSFGESRKSRFRNKSLREARDTTMAEYEYTTDSVIARLKKQKASAFTKLGDSIVELDKKVKELDAKKKEIQKQFNEATALHTDLRNELREKIIGIFDEGEQSMKLIVECLNSSFTVSVKTEENEPRIKNKKGDILTTDYKQVVMELLKQNESLKEQIETIIRQCSVIASEDVIKAGDLRGLRVRTNEAFSFGSVWKKIVKVYDALKVKIAENFAKLTARQTKINDMIANLD